MPADWLKQTFTALSKKKKLNAKKCEDCRLISLTSHALKVFHKILHAKPHKHCEEQIRSMQFSFRNGTPRSNFCSPYISKRCIPICAWQITEDLSTLLDTIRYSTNNETDIDRRELSIIGKLHWNQTAMVRIDHATSKRTVIGRDAYCLHLFLIYTR